MPHRKKYLVTGCAGFIASEVTRQLLERGDSVVGIDNLNDYYDVRLKRYRVDRLKRVAPSPESFEFFPIDLENRDPVRQLFDDYHFDGVINLAARAGVRYSMVDPHVYMTTNAIGSLNLLEAMREHGIKKFVLASTSSLYAGQEMPFVETLPVNTPISPYAASKKAAELMAHTYHYLHGIDVSVCRYFTVFGPADRPDMCIFRFLRWIDEGRPLEVFGDGTQSRDFTFVSDIASGTIAALQPVGYEIFNLGGGKRPVSLNFIIKNLERLLGKKATIDYKNFQKIDMKSTWANIDKANQMLDWHPQTKIDAGLEQCVKWYVDHKPFSQQIQLPALTSPALPQPALCPLEFQYPYRIAG